MVASPAVSKTLAVARINCHAALARHQLPRRFSLTSIATRFSAWTDDEPASQRVAAVVHLRGSRRLRSRKTSRSFS
jgi:hypothetical protein